VVSGNVKTLTFSAVKARVTSPPGNGISAVQCPETQNQPQMLLSAGSPLGHPNPTQLHQRTLPRTYSWVFFRVCSAEKYGGIKRYVQWFFF